MLNTITINLVEPVGEGRFRLETNDGPYFVKNETAPSTGTYKATYDMVGDKRVVKAMEKIDLPPANVDQSVKDQLLVAIISSPALGSVPKNENEIMDIVENWLRRALEIRTKV